MVINVTTRALQEQSRRMERKFIPFDELPVPPANSQGFRRPTREMFIVDEETINQIRTNTRNNLIILNIFILSVSAAISYFMATKALSPIQIMNEKQKLFISSAAHDLKTPLTVIKTDLEVNLRDKDFDKDMAKQTLNNVITEIDRLNTFADQLMIKTKYQSDQLVLTMESINLKTLLQNIIGTVSPITATKDIQILQDLVDCIVQGDKTSLKQAYTNLIDNAIKYSKKGGKISIKLSVDDKCAITTITDNGIGIDSKDIQHIFDPFYRGDQSRSRSGLQNGHGLGLSIANDIIKLYKGTIEVESKLGVFTTLTIRLPQSNTKKI